MYKAKKGFESTVLSFQIGVVKVSLKVEDINQNHIDAYKHYIDLGYYVEKHEPKKVIEYDPQKHDIETILQNEINKGVDTEQPMQDNPILDKPKRTRTKKRK